MVHSHSQIDLQVHKGQEPPIHEPFWANSSTRPEENKIYCIIILFNGPTPASFSFIFGLFKRTIQFLQQINVKTCHVHPVSGTGI